MNTQLIAFYFPQFHAIPENDNWWGKGFNDWDLVKTAKPNYKGHNQPRIPMDGNFYNPCDVATLKKQVDLAKQYGIGGFMFYHYWFDGKLLLEKPLETFLKHTELDFPFCICWANETWTRAWTGHPESILIKQTHIPTEEMWKKHFYYLLPYFKDKRAIKVNGKIVVLIYQPSLVTKGEQMLEYWKELAADNGIGELYFIAIKTHQNNNVKTFRAYDGILKFQPREAYTQPEFATSNTAARFNFLRHLPESMLKYLRKLQMLFGEYHIYDSKELWNLILSKAYVKQKGLGDKDIFESAFFEWDNTPRYGKKAKIFIRPSDVFLKGVCCELLEKAHKNNSPYLFFNAWNEWSESAYLEPDQNTKYANLELLRDIIKSANDKDCR